MLQQKDEEIERLKAELKRYTLPTKESQEDA